MFLFPSALVPLHGLKNDVYTSVYSSFATHLFRLLCAEATFVTTDAKRSCFAACFPACLFRLMAWRKRYTHLLRFCFAAHLLRLACAEAPFVTTWLLNSRTTRHHQSRSVKIFRSRIVRSSLPAIYFTSVSHITTWLPVDGWTWTMNDPTQFVCIN